MSDNDRVVIIGAGIVGSSLAKHLSLLHVPVTLLDRSLSTTLPGSTGLAPGFVGHVNELPTLTELAKRSVEDYKKIPGGFKQVGGLYPRSCGSLRSSVGPGEEVWAPS
jgi:glycine/D-amino acid oxidase-like deaminating enzyme